MDAGDLSTVAFASTEFEAEALRAVLDDAGISSLFLPSGSNLFGFPLRADGGSIPVKVLPEDLSRAKEVLSRAKFIGRSVDWDDVDVGEMPPDVRSVLERRTSTRRAGGIAVAIGALVAAVIVILAVGGAVVWILKTLALSRVAVVNVLVPLVAMAACCCAWGCGYTLHGRVVEGAGSADITVDTNVDAHNRPVPGARIELIRDPKTANRERVATAVSSKDGTFALTVESFGAGWMQEEWVIRISRKGFQNVETMTELPASTNGRLLLVMLAKGRSEKFEEPETSESIMDEARKYDSGVGSMRR
jgi:hypothetical protein